MVVLALQPKGYAASLFYTPFDRTSRCSDPLPSGLLGQHLNRILRGWVGYFHYRSCNTTVRATEVASGTAGAPHVRKRHRVPDPALRQRSIRKKCSHFWSRI